MRFLVALDKSKEGMEILSLPRSMTLPSPLARLRVLDGGTRLGDSPRAVVAVVE
jgi:hypothetical protein